MRNPANLHVLDNRKSISIKFASNIHILCNQAGKKSRLFPRIKPPPWKKTIAGIVLIGNASPEVSGGKKSRSTSLPLGRRLYDMVVQPEEVSNVAMMWMLCGTSQWRVNLERVAIVPLKVSREWWFTFAFDGPPTYVLDQNASS